MSEQEAVNIEPQEPQVLGKFDINAVQIRDPKTHRIIRVNPFRTICHKGKRFIEWPKGSQNLWWEDKTPAGRYEMCDKEKQFRPVEGMAHVKWVAPKTAADRVEEKLIMKDMENKKLAAELDSIKKELAAAKFAKAQVAQQTATKVVKQAQKGKS